jgi:hypothetical protein
MLARDMIALEESLAKAVSANFSSALISEGHTMLTSLMDENRSAAAMLSQVCSILQLLLVLFVPNIDSNFGFSVGWQAQD